MNDLNYYVTHLQLEVLKLEPTLVETICNIEKYKLFKKYTFSIDFLYFLIHFCFVKEGI